MRIELMPQIRMVHWNAEEAKSRAGTLRKSGLSVGLVDFKICAIDATWCALKFAQRK